MRKYISITLTNFGHDHAHLNTAYVYTSFTRDEKRHTHFQRLTYTDGVKLFNKLAKRQGRMPSWVPNEFSRTIANREIQMVL